MATLFDIDGVTTRASPPSEPPSPALVPFGGDGPAVEAESDACVALLRRLGLDKHVTAVRHHELDIATLRVSTSSRAHRIRRRQLLPHAPNGKGAALTRSGGPCADPLTIHRTPQLSDHRRQRQPPHDGHGHHRHHRRCYQYRCYQYRCYYRHQHHHLTISAIATIATTTTTKLRTWLRPTA